MGRINWPGIRKAERVFIICVLLLTTIAGAAGSKAAAAAASLKPSFESAWGIGEAGFLENSIRSLVVDPKEGYNEYYAIADLDNGSSLGLTFAADKGTSNPAYIVKLSDQGGALHQVWIKGIYAAENSSDIPLGGASKDYRIRLNSLAILKDGSLVAVGTGVPYDPIGSLMEGMNYQITLQDFSGNKAAYKHSISKNSVTNYTGIASDGLMVKLNLDGELQGASAIGTKIATSIGGDIALSQVQPTSDGGYVAIGYSRGVSGYFGPIGNRMEPFVIKYNAAGTNEWITHFYEKRSNIANLTTGLLSVTELPGGGYAVAGWSSAKSFSRIYKNGAIYKDAASVDISFPLNNDSSQHKGLIGVLSADGTLQGITTYAPEGAEIADLNDIAASEDGSSLLAVGRAVTGGVPAAFSVKFKTGDLSVEAEKGYSQTSDPLLKDSTADNPENLTTIIPLGDGNYWLGGIANGLAEASAGKTPAGGSAKGGQDIVVIHSDENLNTGWVYLAGGTRNEASFKGAGYEGTLSLPVIAAAGNGLVVYGATKSADGEAAVLSGRSPVSGADGGYNAFVARYGLINPDQVAADAAAQIIGALPETEELTLADKAAVTVAREVYGSLTAPQQALVSAGTLDKLTAAEAKITALEEAKAKVDRESAWQVTYKINNLPSPVALADKAAVTAAREGYDSLTEEQQGLVSAAAVDKLAAAEVAIAVLEAGAEQEAQDQAAAKAVADKIDALPDPVTLADKAAVAAARQQYGSLTEAQQALVSSGTLEKLTAAEAAIAALETAAQQAAADQKAAKAVSDKINALPGQPTLADKTAVTAARQAYSSLTKAQQALVSSGTLEKLTAAEAVIKALETPAGSINPTPSSGAAVPSPAQAVVSSSGSAAVPPAAGGRVGLGEAAVVEIPASALSGSGNVSVKVQPVTAPPAAPAELIPAGTVYEFSAGEAASYTFAKPVTITLAFDPAQIPAGYTAAVYYYDEAAGSWTRVGGTVSGSAVKAEVTHFTKFAVFAEKTAATQQPAVISFKDVEGHWAAAYIGELAARAIAGGYPDGSFRPNQTITRAEYATMLVKALGLEATGASKFKDMDHHWAEGAVLAAADHGIVSGYAGGQFRPDQFITRQEMVAMAARAFGISGGNAPVFADSGSIAAWAKTSVGAAVQAGIVSGQPGNRFEPLKTATRAEASAVLIKALTLK